MKQFIWQLKNLNTKKRCTYAKKIPVAILERCSPSCVGIQALCSSMRLLFLPIQAGILVFK
jgi:hypothetical protein